DGGPPCDFDDSPVAILQGPSTIDINQTVHLQGSATEQIIKPNCQLTRKPTGFSWQLLHKPTGNPEVDVSGELSGANTLTPSFVASGFGKYRAVLKAGNNQIGFDTAQLSITVFQPMELLEARGKVNFLRVNEVGDSFGPAGDSIQVEAIVQLDSKP